MDTPSSLETLRVLIAYLDARIARLPIAPGATDPRTQGFVGLFRVASEEDEVPLASVVHSIETNMKPSVAVVGDWIKKTLRVAFGHRPILPMAWAMACVAEGDEDAREMAENVALQFNKLAHSFESLKAFGLLLAMLCSLTRVRWAKMDAFNLTVVFGPVVGGSRLNASESAFAKDMQYLVDAQSAHRKGALIRMEQLIIHGRRINGVFVKSQRILATFADKQQQRRRSSLLRKVFSPQFKPAKLLLEQASSLSAVEGQGAIVVYSSGGGGGGGGARRGSLIKEGMERQLPRPLPRNKNASVPRRATTEPAPRSRRDDDASAAAAAFGKELLVRVASGSTLQDL